ncbi:hypothetical protein Hanom_Chr06g00485471 [Helianthus anomalus]
MIHPDVRIYLKWTTVEQNCTVCLISLYNELMKLLIEFIHRLHVVLAYTTCTHKNSRLIWLYRPFLMVIERFICILF